MKKMSRLITLFLLILCLFVAIGCSGDNTDKSDSDPDGGTGDSNVTVETGSITGVAAAGAPIIGTVTIKDSASPANTKKVTIEADGDYTVDVSGMTPPFMFRADGSVGGTGYHLYSAGTSGDVGGVINITPFTDLIIANLAGQIAETYFENGDFSGVTSEALTEKTQELKTKIQPVLQAMGVSDSIDLLRTAFSADHTGIDAVMDIIEVSVDPVTEVATIKNIITNQVISDDLNTADALEVLTETAGLSDYFTNYDQIELVVAKFFAFFATSIPSNDNPQLLDLFAQDTFLEEGDDLATFLSNWDEEEIGMTCSNVKVVEMNGAQTEAKIVFDVNSATSAETFHAVWYMVRVDGAWLINGPQTIAYVGVNILAFLNSSDSIETGLVFDVRTGNSVDVDKAVISGPGFDDPLVLVVQIQDEYFGLESNGQSFFPMTDPEIGAFPGSDAEYTFDLYYQNVLLDSYTVTLNSKPYMSTAISADSFPMITQTTADALDSYNGGDILIQWTMPDDISLSIKEVSLGVNLSGGGYEDVERDPDPSDTSATLTLNPSAALTGGELRLLAKDAEGRYFQHNTSF